MECKGIDVSYHQGTIDWKKVKADGIKYAIIRAGYGKTQMDKKFIENICGANTAGIEVGIYWFIYAKDVSEAIENADRCHACISLYKGIIKHKVWADWEYDSDRKNPQNKASRTAIVKAFCERLESHGYDVGVYANPDYMKSKFDMSQLSKYPLWLAKYSSSKGSYNPFMWQYSSKGSVAGISGNVDMNILYDGKAESYPVLHYGDKNEYVGIMQRKLKAKGYDCGKVDNVFGQKTNNALILYKYKNERVEVDECLWQGLMKKF